MRDDIDNLANLMGMAGTAEKAQNHEEAISYFNRVLEADPTYSEAWLGKGRSAGWLSSLANLRVSETLVAFGHAIATAGELDKALVAARAHDDLLALSSALYGMASRHRIEHAGMVSAQSTYVHVTSLLIDTLHDSASWKPGDRRAADQMVLMTRELLNIGVNPELATILRARMETANQTIEAMDSEYVRPALADRTEAQVAQDKAEWDNLGLGLTKTT